MADSLNALLQQQVQAVREAEQQRAVEEMLYIWCLHKLAEGGMAVTTSFAAETPSDEQVRPFTPTSLAAVFATCHVPQPPQDMAAFDLLACCRAHGSLHTIVSVQQHSIKWLLYTRKEPCHDVLEAESNRLRTQHPCKEVAEISYY